MDYQMCYDAEFILNPIVTIIKLAQWIIPILLIILVCFDIFKVIVGHADEKAKNEALSKIAKRLIYAVIVFLIPHIVNFILLKIEPVTIDDNYAINSTSTSYLECWNYYYNK